VSPSLSALLSVVTAGVAAVSAIPAVAVIVKANITKIRNSIILFFIVEPPHANDIIPL
jgi:hypothetical protein